MAADSADRTLYLHWGPGSHAGVERAWFGADAHFAETVFWDQPKVASFDELAAAALEQARSLAGQGRVRLIAHSFGGQLALRIAEALPETVSSVILLACGAHPPDAFVNLGERLGLTEAASAARDRPGPDTFWPLVGGITQVPDFGNRYWAPGSTAARDRYLAIAAKLPPLDLDVFAAVMGHFVGKPADLARSRYDGPVTLWLGSEDPLGRPDAETAAWSARFPQLNVRVVPAGHFIPFEISSELWRPAG